MGTGGKAYFKFDSRAFIWALLKQAGKPEQIVHWISMWGAKEGMQYMQRIGAPHKGGRQNNWNKERIYELHNKLHNPETFSVISLFI